NRSYYEEVLVVRVHPQMLIPQRLPQVKALKPKTLEKLWKQRFREINAFERSLVSNGTVVIKFFLHLSRDEQKQRFLERIKEPEKNWKFNPGDIEERKLWPDYMTAFEETLAATSTQWAPWYVIPADNKWYARAAIADIIAPRLENLNLKFPKISDEQLQLYEKLGKELEAQ
ncbi:MAG: polyphosphate kinase 2 family protein, partial [Aureliella sp.]